MLNKDYLTAGIAALTLAVVYPFYWFHEIIRGVIGDTDALMQNITSLGLPDAVFLAIGLLSIFVYLKLYRILNDYLNLKSINLLLILTIAVHVIFLLSLGLDIAASLLSEQAIIDYQDVFIGIGLTMTIGALIMFGLLNILIGIVLLTFSAGLPTLLKIFALITLIQGIAEISVVFSFVSILSFPLSLIILAMYFLQEPESLEVV